MLTGTRRAALAIAALALAASCAPGPPRLSIPIAGARATATMVRVQLREGSRLVVREVPIEEYVAATALSEVHPDVADAAAADGMFEVQTVIARTYALTNLGRHAAEGFDLCSTTHCQIYEPARLVTSRWAPAARTAARATAGRILWFADAPARALFHADCGGHTSAAGAVWGGLSPPYLAGRDDSDARGAHTPWTFEARTDALRVALNQDPRTAVGAKLDTVEVAGRDAAGRAEQIVLRGSRTFVVRGEVFRDVVTRRFGVRALRSTLFTIKKTRGMLLFSGKGFGHGVGLCQAGALARLRAGATPQAVLAYYFPGTVLRP